jgi:hypothetical protein
VKGELDLIDIRRKYIINKNLERPLVCIDRCHMPGNKSYGIVLGTFIKKLKVKISTFLNKKKFDFVNDM